MASTRLFLKGFFSSACAKAGPNRVAPRQSRLRRASSGHAWGLVVGLALGFGSGAAHATLVVNQPWVRYSVSAHSADVYMDITSSDSAVVVAVSSAAAASAALTGPRGVKTIALPAGMMVRLAHGGPRIVLRRLAHPLRLGDYIALSLTVEDSAGVRMEIPVRAEVRRHSPLDDERREHHH